MLAHHNSGTNVQREGELPDLLRIPQLFAQGPLLRSSGRSL